ncbi:hypothetical protein SG09_35580 [Bradyrhizobium ottawaense]|nr:hypothetical protein SG09_35580 [Bradyrhizobium ottawaense]GMO46208.1 hypothetical protein BwSF21_62450 [Bradyrhizobium ottawaense]
MSALPDLLAVQRVEGLAELAHVRACIFRIGFPCSLLPSAYVEEVGLSQFLSMLLIVAAVVLTVCFGVAAWRLSDERE